jgi:hypothetical protein
MRKIREILRLKHAGLSERHIAKGASVARSTVQDCLRRAREAGVAWPLPDGWDEARLEQALYPPPPASSGTVPLPGFGQLDQELRRKGVPVTSVARTPRLPGRHARPAPVPPGTTETGSTGSGLHHVRKPSKQCPQLALRALSITSAGVSGVFTRTAWPGLPFFPMTGRMRPVGGYQNVTDQLLM